MIRSGSRRAETDLRHFALGRRADLEELARLEIAHGGHQVRGKLRDARSGLPLGAQGKVVANGTEAGIVTVNVGGQQTTLGRAAADKIRVTSKNV